MALSLGRHSESSFGPQERHVEQLVGVFVKILDDPDVSKGSLVRHTLWADIPRARLLRNKGRQVEQLVGLLRQNSRRDRPFQGPRLFRLDRFFFLHFRNGYPAWVSYFGPGFCFVWLQ